MPLKFLKKPKDILPDSDVNVVSLMDILTTMLFDQNLNLRKRSAVAIVMDERGDMLKEFNVDNDGDMVLVKQQVTANNGDVVVALIDDEATVKEFSRQGDMVILKPRSNNKKHRPIILTRDFQIQGIVITSIHDL